ncbi:MAG: hypothetical protein AB1634_02875 [Thermodesulfobacteriota bacterium]
MSLPSRLARLDEAPLADKLRQAEALLPWARAEWAAAGSGLAGLAELADHLTALAQVMTDLGLPGLCAACGSRPGGGCCSAEMGEAADVILLLLNRLLGAEIRLAPGADGGCPFLAAGGCRLLVKPVFCLGYNCGAIHARLAPTGWARLDQATGPVQSCQYRLEQEILGCLRSAGAFVKLGGST